MSSRILKLVFSAFIVAALNVACNLETGDWVAPNDRGRLTYSCLSELDREVREFLSGDLKEGEITKMMGCVRTALDEFDHIFNKANKSGFRPKELSEFLNLKFLGDSKITPELLTELMNIKVVIVGGESNFVLKAEFDRLIDLTHIIEDEARRNVRYMKIYRNLLTDEERAEIPRGVLESAKYRLAETAGRIALILKDSSQAYKVSDFEKLIKHSRIFLNWEQESTSAMDMDQVMEIVQIYKQFSVGSETQEIAGKEEEIISPKRWAPFFDTFVKWYGIYLDYCYHLDGERLVQGIGLEDFIKAVGDAEKLLIDSIGYQKGSSLHFGLLNRILIQLQNFELIPESLKMEESLKPAFRYVVEKIMRDLNIPLIDAKSDGLRMSHVREFKSEFDIWADGQKYLDRKYNGNYRIGIDESAGQNEIQNLIKNTEAFSRKNDSRVWVLGKALQDKLNIKLEQNFESLTRLNVIKIFSRLLIRGFAQEPERAKFMLGITEGEAENFYEISKSLGQDLEFMDRRKSGVGKRFFKEANLFTFSADGIHADDGESVKHLLSFQEAIEQLALVYSGSIVQNKIYDSAIGAKCSSLAKDKTFDRTLLKKDCFVKDMANKSYKTFGNLPGMIEYFKSVGRLGRVNFFNSMLEISHPACGDHGIVEYGELATVATLAHYVEVVFKTYDKDQDGILNGLEVMSSYSKFRGFIKPEVEKRKGEKNDEFIKSVFAFLLIYGDMPTTGNWYELGMWDWKHFNNEIDQYDIGCEKNWRGKLVCPTAPDMSVSRADILKVLGILVSSGEKPKCNDPDPTPYTEFTNQIESMTLPQDHAQPNSRHPSN